MGCHFLLQCMKGKSESEVAQSCPTPSNPMDYQAPPSMGFSRQEYWSGLPLPSPMQESESEMKSLSRVRLLVTPWTAAHQAPPSMGFSRQEYWSGLPLPSPPSPTRLQLLVIHSQITIYVFFISAIMNKIAKLFLYFFSVFLSFPSVF